MNARDKQRQSDPWGEVVIGYPSFIRHHSGKGFKPMLRIPYDFNVPLDLGRDDGRGHVRRRWHNGGDGDWDEARVGERLFLYCTDDDPPFGFLATILEIDSEGVFIDLSHLPRFDAYLSPPDTSIGQPPPGWLAPTSWHCEHMSVSGSITRSPTCGACGTAMAAGTLTA